ncbi:ABC transporter permease [Oscillospiraceae bacterium PP1C4]
MNFWQIKGLNKLKNGLYPFLTILLALLLGAGIIYAMGFDPLLAYSSLLKGAFGNRNAIGETLLRTTPLIFTAISYAIAQRCGLINLGGEGQLYIGALCGTLAGTLLSGLPLAIHLPLTILAGFLGGAFWGLIVGVLKVRFGASELITTIMLNYIAMNLVSFCVTGPFKDPSPGAPPQTVPILDSARLPRIMAGTRLHAGLLVALLGLAIYYIFLWRTTKGYEMRVIGMNPNAGRYAGMNLTSNSLLAIFIAGGFAGIGGCSEIIGVQFRLIQNFSTSYGFDGVAVALLGGGTPIGIAISAVLFGALNAGSGKMQMFAKVPSAVVYMIQGMIILFAVGRALFPWLRKTIVTHLPKKVSAKEAART